MKGCRSEEHTSELQSRSDLVCRLLLEKKKHTQALMGRKSVRTAAITRTRTLCHGSDIRRWRVVRQESSGPPQQGYSPIQGRRRREPEDPSAVKQWRLQSRHIR